MKSLKNKKNKLLCITNLKYTVITIISFIVFTFIGVYAVNTINSNTVSFSSGFLTSTNVQDAIDEIYAKIKNSTTCPSGYTCKKKMPVVGDYVRMPPSTTSFTTDTSKTGYTSEQTVNPSELDLWRVLKINNDGTIEMISENVSSVNVYFSGQTGYQNLTGYLNVIASKYENSNYTIGSRIFGYKGQTEYITDTSIITSKKVVWKANTGTTTVESQGGGDTLYEDDYNLVTSVLGSTKANKVDTTTATAYWSASRFYNYSSSTVWYFKPRIIGIDGKFTTSSTQLYYYSSGLKSASKAYAIRPIVILKAGNTFTPADGTLTDPFVIEDSNNRWDYRYTGNEQTFQAPYTGTYKLEVWGAGGGASRVDGVLQENDSTGGYATGMINLAANSKLYIYVGGKGQNAVNGGNATGGYNGGGSGSWDQSTTELNKDVSESSGAGGGATHIATTSRGVLVNYINNQSEVLIVAGGGGGSSYNSTGGHGGGKAANRGSGTGGTAGTQTDGCAFGSGCSGTTVGRSTGVAGGGGGWYGGKINTNTDADVGSYNSAGGGSGYIGNSQLFNKAMYCYNCAASSDEDTLTIKLNQKSSIAASTISKVGNGYARITLISKN